jgi:hypothetical protein
LIADAQPHAAVVPTVELEAPERPRLRPAAASNQNVRDTTPFADDDEDLPRRWGAARVVAWVLLAPWYLGVALATLGIDAMFVKDLLGV